MTSVQWEEPPKPNGGPRANQQLLDFANELRANPGRWALYPTVPSSDSATSSNAANIRRGTLAAFRPPGAFEAVARTAGGIRQIYVRYVGGDQS